MIDFFSFFLFFFFSPRCEIFMSAVLIGLCRRAGHVMRCQARRDGGTTRGVSSSTFELGIRAARPFAFSLGPGAFRGRALSVGNRFPPKRVCTDRAQETQVSSSPYSSWVTLLNKVIGSMMRAKQLHYHHPTTLVLPRPLLCASSYSLLFLVVSWRGILRVCDTQRELYYGIVMGHWSGRTRLERQ